MTDIKLQNDTLSKYEPFIDKWLEDVPMEKFDKKFQGRLSTFSYCFEKLKEKPSDYTLIVVELGTSRSFVDGRFPGCNSNDTKYWEPDNLEKWDFGAGAFTYLCAEFLTENHPNFQLYTVDLSKDHLNRCKHMTKKFKNIQYVHMNSLDFLKTFKTKCDLIYVDTGDVTPIEPTALVQLDEAKLIVEEKLIQQDGHILIDDVRNYTSLKQQPKNVYGKAKYSIPYLKKNGFEIVLDEYQVIFKHQE